MDMFINICAKVQTKSSESKNRENEGTHLDNPSSRRPFLRHDPDFVAVFKS